MFAGGNGSRKPPEDKRRAILQAALELFSERGFHAANVPQIAERANVAVGTIYHYFASKEAIVNALYRELKAELNEAIFLGFPFQAPLREQFHEYWRRLTAYALERPEAYSFLEIHHHAPYLDEQSRESEIPMLRALQQTYEAAGAQGILRPLPLEVVFSMVMGTLTAMMKASAEGRLAMTPDVLEQTEACLWDAITNK